VLFCDLTGSTALGETLDPERLRALLANYFDRMKAIVERHGATVEKFIGDAVMGVFGVPVVHEDDALLAVRSAVEMRGALPELGLQGRIGVMTGEVVTGTEERLATGDAVNVAARLEQAAQPGEVLIGQPTLALVRDAAEVEPVDPLELKGKAEPVLAALFALDRLDEAYAWTGRAEELGASDDAFTQLVWRQVRAKVLARRGQHAESERLAREAVAIGEGTEFVSGQGDANADLAEVLLLAGRVEEAAEALEVALARYERKGNVVMVERMRDRLEGLREETRKREL
jgi:class 3 adenylate cyclase